MGIKLVQGLYLARGPTNDCFLDLGIFAQTKVKLALILCTESTAAGDNLHLFLPVPEKGDFRSDRAAIAGCSLEFEVDPVVLGSYRVLVNEQRTSLVGHDHVKHAAVPEIDEGHGTAVVGVGNTHGLGNIHELAGAIIHPDFFVLITRQAAPVHGRPVLSVANDGGVAAGNLGEVIPIIAVAIQGNVAIGEIQIQGAVVIQIAELCAEAPTAQFDAQIARQVLIFQAIATCSFFGHPQVVALDEHAVFRNIGNIHREIAAIEDVSEGYIHSALGGKADAGLFAYFAETVALVEIEFGNAVVIGDEKIGAAGSAQIRRRRSERPMAAVDSHLRSDIFELTVANVMEKIFATSVFGIFKTLGHHPSRFEVPEINIFGVVSADEKVQSPVAIVVKPDGGVRIQPRRQTRLLGDAGESLAVIVVKEFGLAPFVEKQVFVAVVVVVTPNRSHGYTGPDLIQVSDAHLRGDVFKSSISEVAIQRVLAAFTAVGGVNVRPSVTVEIHYRHRSAHGSDFGHDVF